MNSRFPPIGIYLALLLVLTATPLLSQDGLALMKNDPGARPAGMGAAFVSFLGDPNGTSFNPATATGTEKTAVSFGHNSLWKNVRLESGYIAAPLSTRNFIHAGIRYATVDNIERRQAPSTLPDALFELRDISAKIGYSRKINAKWSAGIAAGFFFEKIDVNRGSAFNIDLGLHYKATEQFYIGAAVNNLGSDFKLGQTGSAFESRDISLPTVWRLGGSYRFTDYIGALDFLIQDDEFRVHTGAEWDLDPRLVLRSGYMFGYDSRGFTAGASFTRRNLTFDYAFVPFSNNLGSSHQFNLTISL